MKIDLQMKLSVLYLSMMCPLWATDLVLSNNSSTAVFFRVNTASGGWLYFNVPSGHTLQVPKVDSGNSVEAHAYSFTSAGSRTEKWSSDAGLDPSAEVNYVFAGQFDFDNGAVSATSASYARPEPNVDDMDIFLQGFWWSIGAGLLGLMYYVVRRAAPPINHTLS